MLLLINNFKSYPTKLLFNFNLSQTLPTVPLRINGSNTNSNSSEVGRMGGVIISFGKGEHP
jgi:hypothetical protein